MMLKILEDAAKHPELFLWFGSISPSTLKEWIAKNQFAIPDQLFSFWTQTGGGDVFESETILGPFGDEDLGDDVVGVNSYAHEHGLDPNYMVFHAGLMLSVIRASDHHIVTLSPPDLTKIGEFVTFDQWYIETLRAEYAERYGIE